MSKNVRNKNYRRPSQDRKGSAFGRFLVTLMIFGIVVFIFIKYAFPIIKQETKKVAAKKTVEVLTDNIDKIAGDNEQIKEAVENMSEEDKETLAGIIENHMDAESTAQVIEYVNEGNKEELLKYAAENLTQEEMMELMEMYSKYAED